jgi:WD40 repeat protein
MNPKLGTGMADLDALILGVLRERDAKAPAASSLGTLLDDYAQVTRMAVAARRKRALPEVFEHVPPAAAASTASKSGAVSSEREDELKDKLISLQEKHSSLIEAKSAALERANAAEQKLRGVQDQLRGCEERLAACERDLADARGQAARDSEEATILRSEVEALRERSIRAESDAGDARKQYEVLLDRFLREKEAAAASMNALTQDFLAVTKGATPASLSAEGSAALAAASRPPTDVPEEIDEVLAAALVSTAAPPGGETAGPRSLFRRIGDAHAGQCTAATFSPNGSIFVTAGTDGVVRVWDGVTCRKKMNLTLSGSMPPSGTSASPASTVSTPLCVDIAGDVLLAGTADKSVVCWDIATGRMTHTLGGHTGRVMVVRGVSDGRTALSAGTDRTLRLWDLRAHRPVRTISTTSIPQGADVTGDGSFAVAGHLNKSLRVFDLGRGVATATRENVHPKSIISVGYSKGDSSARVLSFGQDGSWRILNAISLTDASPPATTSTPTASPAGGIATMFGSMFRSGGVSSASLITGPPDLVSLPGFRPWSKRGEAALSPLTRGGGFVAATGEDGSIALWTAQDGEFLRSLKGAHADPATAVCWSPDGRKLVSADSGGVVAIWQ